ncbi:MAG: hypothetical protein EBT68_01320 [Verrucomicrobia bacterium]|nr:hypothetical protein [Verrucomicrobiota bacterium]NBR62793.1 hypothetical protein [Verrucomicrobiota bacterium]
MLFLIDSDLPRSLAGLISGLGHKALDARDLGLGAAPDEKIAAEARQREACLVTGDFGFADIRNYPPGDYAGLAVLEIPGDAGTEVILSLVRSWLTQPDLLNLLPGRLAIVAPGRIRLRPAPLAL